MKPYISSDQRFHRPRPAPRPWATFRGERATIYINGEPLSGAALGAWVSQTPELLEPFREAAEGLVDLAERMTRLDFSLGFSISAVGTTPIAGEATGPALLPLPRGEVKNN